MDHVREALVAEGLAARTVSLYLRTIQRADDWCRAHDADLATASAVLVAAYVDTRPSSWSSRNLLRAALGHYWRIVERPAPPVKAIRVPPKPGMVCRALDEGDARIFAKAARETGGRRGLAIALGLYMALRREEIATLRWADFRDDGVYVTGKGSKTAWVPVHPRVAALLPELEEREGEHVFAGRFGGHVTPATVWHWVRTAAEEAGLGRVPTHVTRHTALATANDNTGDLRAVQSFARHSRPETTAGYTRTTARRLREVVEAVDY